jgi:hypothetical protein
MRQIAPFSPFLSPKSPLFPLFTTKTNVYALLFEQLVYLFGGFFLQTGEDVGVSIQGQAYL